MKNLIQFFCFYSIYSPDSLYNAETSWYKEIKHYCRNVPIILVANKIDIRNDIEALQKAQCLQQVSQNIFSYQLNSNSVLFSL